MPRAGKEKERKTQMKKERKRERERKGGKKIKRRTIRGFEANSTLLT